MKSIDSPPTGTVRNSTSSKQQGEHSNRQEATGVLVVGILAFAFAYVILFWAGWRFFVWKTAVMPVFLLYAVALRRRKAYVSDWLPLLAGTVLFDALRGAIYTVTLRFGLPIHAVYATKLERFLFGTPAAPIGFQHARAHWLDLVAVGIHASHFAFFLIFGLVLWHYRQRHFTQFRQAIMITMLGGLVGYFAVPTVPPWLASSQYGLFPPVTRVVAEIYTVISRELYGSFDTNPVAAMPSLHVAFPTVCALIGGRAFGTRIGVLLWAYVAIVACSAMYLGEHYGIDVLGGLLLAWASTASNRLTAVGPVSIGGAVVLSAVLIGLTVLVLTLF